MTVEEIETALRESAEVRDTILYQAYASTVALFAVSEHGQDQSLELAGTGTLVEVDGSQYILTAAHVWGEVLKTASKVGISLPENRDHSFLMDVSTVVPVGPPKPDSWNEWGPDVIFLRIPQAHVGAIRAFRTLYNLSFKGISEQEKIALKTTHLELWVFIGAPHEFGKFPAKNYADIQINAFFASAPVAHLKNGFDFLDFKGETSLPGVPKSFGGVSGGGLWKILAYASPATGNIDSMATLEGVAFYELPVDDNHSVIRGHGPKTIAATKPTP
jgi:hypothetical protein